MFDLTITSEIKAQLREIRKQLKAKGYKQVISTTNSTIGTIIMNYKYEYFIKGNNIFTLETDRHNGTLTTRYNFCDTTEYGKKIMLSSVLELA